MGVGGEFPEREAGPMLSTYRGGILGRRKRYPERAGVSKKPSISALSERRELCVPGAGAGRGAVRPVPYPDRPAQRTPRYERDLIGSVLCGSCPLLLDRDEAMIALDLTAGVFADLVRQGGLKDWVVVGDRQLFRAAQIRELILQRRRELAEQVAARGISDATKARQQAREQARERDRARRAQAGSPRSVAGVGE
jgi:hypothetical protein